MKRKKQIPPGIWTVGAALLWLLPLVGGLLGMKSVILSSKLMADLYWAAAGVAVIPALFGKWRFSCAVFVSAFLGILLGEAFGPNPAGEELGFGHYGWAIWSVTVFAGLLFGIAMEVVSHKRRCS